MIVSKILVETIGSLKNVNCRKTLNIFFIEQLIKVILCFITALNKKNEIVYWISELTITIGYGYIFYQTLVEDIVFYSQSSNIVVLF